MNQINKEKNNPPMVSICMLTYNHEAYISEAIEGVLMQKTSFTIKLIIGEDFSTDNTRAICKDYQQKHPDIIELLPERNSNLGMMPNLIRTLKACTGKYIAMCEGDDYWIDENKLQMQVDILNQHNEHSLVYTYQQILKKGNIIDSSNTSQKIKSINDVLEGFIPPTRTILFRNINGLSNFLEDKKTQPSGDKFIAYYLSLYGTFLCIGKTTSVYRITDTGVWTSISPEVQIVIALVYYFEFLKQIQKSQFKFHFIKRLVKFIKNTIQWFAPQKAIYVYIDGVKTLFKKKFYTQGLLLLTLVFYFFFSLQFKLIVNKLNLSHNCQ